MKNVIIFLIFVLGFINIVYAFPNTATIYCQEMGYQIKNNDCVFSDGTDCNLYDFYNSLCGKNYTKELSCAQEGEYALPGHICCNGLIEIKALNRLENGNCKDPEPLGSWRVCSNCGNGVCDKKENYCNCKKDCNESEGFNNYSRLKTGCENRGGNCIKISKDCDEGYIDTELDKSYCFSSNEKCCTPINENPGSIKNPIENENNSEETEECPLLNVLNCPEGSIVESQGKDEKDCPKENKCIKNLSNGRKAEIKIMPETASLKARERLGELGFNIVLKEVGNNNETKPVYELTTEKDVKILGFIKSRAKVIAIVHAETGELIQVKNPWWIFLATKN